MPDWQRAAQAWCSCSRMSLDMLGVFSWEWNVVGLCVLSQYSGRCLKGLGLAS